MKLSLNLIAALCMLAATSCKKSTDNPPVTSGSKNTPNFAGPHFKFNSGSGWQQKGFIFYDLNHDANKDKKYFVAERINAGSDSMKITVAPLPIDSLATNWPAQVKSASYGYNSDLIVSAHMRLLVQSVNTSGQIVYRYDSIYKLSGGTQTYNYFNNPSFADVMTGKNPQGEAVFQVLDASNNVTFKNTILYFKESYYTTKTAGRPAEFLSTLLPGIINLNYDWRNVNQVIYYQKPNTSGGGTISVYLFLDYKNWRYFTIEQKVDCSLFPVPCSIVNAANDYQSLDKLLKWPDGWGK